MAKKLIITITGLILFIGVALAAEKVTSTTTTAKLSEIAVFAADTKRSEGPASEKTKEKAEAAKPEQTRGCEMQKHKEGLIDQLLKAYKADDKKAMGEIITKLEKRQEQMRKFAQFERWHQMAHRRMMMRGWGRQQGFNGGGCGGCPGMQMNRNWGPPAGSSRPMPQWKHPGGFGPMPQWNQCPQGQNQQTAPPAKKPGAMWNNDDPDQNSDSISALDDDDMFTGPDDEFAMNNDTPADSEW